MTKPSESAKNIVIIGNGISGITAARHIRKRSNHKIMVISSESDHFYSRTALMYIFMGHMRYEHTKPFEDNFWPKNKIDLVRDYVEKVDFENKVLYLQNSSNLTYDILILATGSRYNTFNWPGQNFSGVQGLVNLQDLETMEQNTSGVKEAVLVGGGLIGIEMAEMLKSRDIDVTILVREENYWGNVLPEGEAKMVNRHILEHGVKLKLKTELKEIHGDEKNKVHSITTSAGETISCGFVGIAVGVKPNTEFLKGSGLETDVGILVNDFFETNINDVYAIGDCAQYKIAPEGRRAVEQVWYTGRMHGETLALTICGDKTSFKPGPWFNSAKFFDIEYQVYGIINPIKADDEEHLYWEHQSGKKSIRIAYKKESRSVIGFNLMGIRYKHEVCDRWIRSQTKIDAVLSKLKEANFDPEFFKKYEKEIMKQFTFQLNGKEAVEQRKKFWGIF